MMVLSAGQHENDSEAEHERLLKTEASGSMEENLDEDTGSMSTSVDFYKAELDQVKRKLGGTHIQM